MTIFIYFLAYFNSKLMASKGTANKRLISILVFKQVLISDNAVHLHINSR